MEGPVSTRAGLRQAGVALRIAVLLGFLCGLAGHALAAGTFVVDAANPGFTDTGPGTEATPYCTISAAAVARWGPGTTILVKPAIYREQVNVPVSGADGSPFVFQALGPGVVIDGTDDFSDPALWTPFSGDVWLAQSVTWVPQRVFFEGAPLIPSTAEPADIAPGTFRHIPQEGLYVNLGGDNPGMHQTLVGRRLHGFRLYQGDWVTFNGYAGQYVTHPLRFLGEVRRVLRPGGCAVFVNRVRPVNDWATVRRLKESEGAGAALHGLLPVGMLAFAVNAVGDVWDHIAGKLIAGARTEARTIANMLGAGAHLGERDLLALQLDTRSYEHDRLQRLVLEAVPPAEADPILARARRQAELWNGRADREQAAFRLLQVFGEELREAVLVPLLAPALAEDPGLVFNWPLAQESVERILEERPDHLLPPGHQDWTELLRSALRSAIERVQHHPAAPGLETPWGDANRAAIHHPFGMGGGLLARLLNMPADPLPGWVGTVRAQAPAYGASLRIASLRSAPLRNATSI